MKCTDLRVGRIAPLARERLHVILGTHMCSFPGVSCFHRGEDRHSLPWLLRPGHLRRLKQPATPPSFLRKSQRSSPIFCINASTLKSASRFQFPVSAVCTQLALICGLFPRPLLCGVVVRTSTWCRESFRMWNLRPLGERLHCFSAERHVRSVFRLFNLPTPPRLLV